VTKPVLMRGQPAMTHLLRWDGVGALFRREPLPAPEEILEVQFLDPNVHPTMAQAGVRSVIRVRGREYYCLESVAQIQRALPKS
jgi:hypothetical protein